MINKIYLFCFVVMISFIGASSSANTKKIKSLKAHRVPTNEESDFATQFAQAINTDHSSGLGEETYKFVVFLNMNGQPDKLLFQNAQKFEFHADFLATQPGFAGMSREQIDRFTYQSGPNRKAILGSVIVRSGDDSIFYSRMQLMTEEAPPGDVVVQIHKMIMDSTAGDLDLIPGGKIDFEVLRHQEAGFASQIEKLASSGIEIFRSRNKMESVSYTDAWSTGKLVLVSSEDDLKSKVTSGEINSNSIILTDQNLREIPNVAGVISSVELTPASHLVLLGQMYGSPIVYFKFAMQIFMPLMGKTIYLNSKNEANGYDNSPDYLPEPSEDVLKRLEQFKMKQVLKVELNLEEKNIRDTRGLSFRDISAFGGKASQIGILQRAIPENTLDVARAIPIAFYKEFISKTKARTGDTLEQFIQKSLQNLGDHPTATAISTTLQMIRDEIKATRLPAEMLATIRGTLEQAFPGSNVRLKLRSSSNAEDGAEFNGAGLYDSEGVSLTGGKPDDLEKGINKVWRSLYTDRGYNARRRFSADENKVGMGILVQKTIKNELANGVLVFNSGKKASNNSFNVYTYKGEDLQVTHGTGEIQPEIVSGVMWGDGETRITVKQGFDGGSLERTIMRVADYRILGELMSKVAIQYGSSEKSVNIECEFKQIEDGNNTKIVIKQVRSVPQKKNALAADGSQFYYIFPRRLALRMAEYSDPNALKALLSPKKITLQIDSLTEKELKKGLKVRDVQFEILGESVKIAAPVVKGNVIYIPTKKFPSLRLIARLPDFQRNVFSVFNTEVDFSLESDEKDWKFTKKYDQLSMGSSGDEESEDSGSRGRHQVYFAFHPEGPFSDWSNENILGNDKLIFEITGKYPFVIHVNKMKRNGREGDSRSVRLGEAEIIGLYKRPIKLLAPHMSYGANHHGEGEAFGFDLAGDPSLNDKEKAEIISAGRYLIISPSDLSNDNKKPTFRLSDDGQVKKLGDGKITLGET